MPLARHHHDCDAAAPRFSIVGACIRRTAPCAAFLLAKAAPPPSSACRARSSGTSERAALLKAVDQIRSRLMLVDRTRLQQRNRQTPRPLVRPQSSDCPRSRTRLCGYYQAFLGSIPRGMPSCQPRGEGGRWDQWVTCPTRLMLNKPAGIDWPQGRHRCVSRRSSRVPEQTHPCS